jgi:ribonuclease Z
MTRVEINFLGTTASIPTSDRNHPSVYIKYNGKEEGAVLFDCGESTQRQIFKAGLNFMRIDHIFITHWHADHYAGLFGILETMSLEKRKDPLYVYGPEASRFVEILTSLGYAGKNFRVVPRDVEFSGNDIETLVEEKEFSVIATPVKHGVPAVAYALVEKDRIRIDSEKALELGLPKQGPIFNKLKEEGKAIFRGKTIHLKDISATTPGKKIVYSGDTQPCRNLVTLAENAEVLIMDCTYFEDMEERHHTNLNQAIEMASHANVKELILTHISRRYQSQSELEKLAHEAARNSGIKSVKVARDFMKVLVE